MIGRQHASGDLPDDLVLEILRRVPYRSLCRFKAVSPPWLALCSAAALRRNKPLRYRTLSGFLYHSTRQNHPDLWGYYGRRYGFIDVVKNGRPNPMVDASRWSHSHLADVTLVDCCNGLLLLRGTSADAIVYAVCNPATPDERLLVLPPPPLSGELGQRASSYDQMRLGFDPAVSPHQFTVFFLHCGSASAGRYGLSLSVYSSEAKTWIPSTSSVVVRACPRRQTAFFNGSLHLLTEENLVLAVDKEGEAWRSIRTPCRFSFLGHSEGRLCAVEQPQGHRWNVLAIWFLEDYGGEHWAMKHSVVDAAGLFPACGITTGGSSYTVVAFHPDREMVFLCAGVHRHLMSYDMDSGKSKYICTSTAELYLPYIPCLYQSG